MVLSTDIPEHLLEFKRELDQGIVKNFIIPWQKKLAEEGVSDADMYAVLLMALSNVFAMYVEVAQGIWPDEQAEEVVQDMLQKHREFHRKLVQDSKREIMN